MTENKYINQSIQRAIKLLDLFYGPNKELSLSEISRKINLPKTNVYRIVLTLEEGGYLTKNHENSKYRLGIKILSLCNSILNDMPYRELVFPILKDLSLIAGETVALILYIDGKAICIEKIESNDSLKISCYVGQSFYLHRGSTGLALLMGMPTDMMKNILYTNKPLPQLSDKTITDPDEIINLIEENRAKGYISSTGMVDPGVSAISVPVSCAYKNIYMGISILGPEHRLTEEKKTSLIEPLKKCAEQIAHIISLS